MIAEHKRDIFQAALQLILDPVFRANCIAHGENPAVEAAKVAEELYREVEIGPEGLCVGCGIERVRPRIRSMCIDCQIKQAKERALAQGIELTVAP